MKIHGNYLVQAIGLSALMLTASACSKTEAPAGGMNSANIVDEIGQATEHWSVPEVQDVKRPAATLYRCRGSLNYTCD